MRMRKHFATGAAATQRLYLVLTACGGRRIDRQRWGHNDTLTAGAAHEITDHGPITTGTRHMTNRQRGLPFNMADWSAPQSPVTP